MNDVIKGLGALRDAVAAAPLGTTLESAISAAIASLHQKEDPVVEAVTKVTLRSVNEPPPLRCIHGYSSCCGFVAKEAAVSWVGYARAQRERAEWAEAHLAESENRANVSERLRKEAVAVVESLRAKLARIEGALK